MTTVFSHRMISRSWSTENGVSPPLFPPFTACVRSLFMVYGFSVGTGGVGCLGYLLLLAVCLLWSPC